MSDFLLPHGLQHPAGGMDLPDPGMEPGSPELRADTLPSEPLGKTIAFDYTDLC